ncbi:uncharacterized protein LOC124284276 [Haliotis rubra]|uniref:uncharacterized protein LOC124284276 n=1 Tax=Haliotis rubra TaxID=36100 RepID=UPI001EE55B13|nr:uncharacterized protein LOC124284276 [Haliotis rubra]
MSYSGTKCSIYRSSVSRSGTSTGTITFLKHGALPTPDPCPVSEGYTSVLSPRMCYRLHTKRKTSPQTHNLCEKEGGRLMILNTDEKYDHMAAYTKRIDSRPWIALFVKGKNNYEWSDGSTYIRSGAKSLTKFYIGYGACGFLYRGEIRSRYCKNGYEYLCEILVA